MFPFLGFTSFTNTVTLGLELGVKEITTYALSIDNLKRPKEELDGLWNLMEVKFTKILYQIDEFLARNVKIQLIGNLSLLPDNLKELCARIDDKMEVIRESELTCFLAICYTSRDEITSSMKKLLSEVSTGGIYPSDIDDELLQKCLYGAKYPVDMIVRTSGETRLSDFLLWQCSKAVLYFTDVLWPEFNQWEMLKSVMYFQYCRIKYGESNIGGYAGDVRIEEEICKGEKMGIEYFLSAKDIIRT